MKTKREIHETKAGVAGEQFYGSLYYRELVTVVTCKESQCYSHTRGSSG